MASEKVRHDGAGLGLSIAGHNADAGGFQLGKT